MAHLICKNHKQRSVVIPGPAWVGGGKRKRAHLVTGPVVVHRDRGDVCQYGTQLKYRDAVLSAQDVLDGALAALVCLREHENEGTT